MCGGGGVRGREGVKMRIRNEGSTEQGTCSCK